MQTKVKKSQNSEAWAKLDCCPATENNYSNAKGIIAICTLSAKSCAKDLTDIS